MKTTPDKTQTSFSAADQERLTGSAAWQKDPQFVEAMYLLFYERDPMGCWSSENPKAMTEYLLEVELLATTRAEIRSQLALALVIKRIFDRMFEGDPDLARVDWDGLAQSAWPIVTADTSF